MAVKLDIADSVITVGDKGLLLSISDNSGAQLGHLRIGQSSVEWRKGASRAGRGKKIPLQQFIASLEESIEGGATARPAAATKRAAKAPAKRGPGRPRKNAAATKTTAKAAKASARPAGRRGGRKAAAASLDTQAVRVWAQDNGHQISSRGRLPASVIEAYRQANS